MEIEYIYPNNNDNDLEKQLKQMKRESTLGCLIFALLFLGAIFIFLTILPVILVVIGYSILFLGIYIVYKAYIEDMVISLINKIKR